MPVAPGATARSIIFLLRCRPKAPTTKNHSAPRNRSTRIQSQPRHVIKRRIRLRRRTRRKKRRGFGTRGGSTLVSKSRPLESIPRPQWRKSRPNASTVIRKVTMQISALNLQKTSIGLSNFHANGLIIEVRRLCSKTYHVFITRFNSRKVWSR